MSGGILTAYILGAFFSWYNLAWISCCAAGEYVNMFTILPSLHTFLHFFSVFDIGYDSHAQIASVATY